MRGLRNAQFPPQETYDRGQIAALNAIQALQGVLPPEQIDYIIDRLSKASSPNEVSTIVRKLVSF